MRESFAVMIGVLVLVGILLGSASAQQYDRSVVEGATKMVIESNSASCPYAGA